VLLCCQGGCCCVVREDSAEIGERSFRRIYNSSVCGTKEQNNFKSDNHITFLFEHIQGGSQVFIF